MTADLWSDFPPSAPQNLVLTNAGQNGQNPILQWNANTEPDLDHYGIHRGDQDSPGGSIFWHTVVTTTNTTWTDTQIIINTSGSATVYYKITAVDTAEQESDFSNTVSTKTNIIPKPSTSLIDEKSANLPRELALYQNFPNPFNPQTEIRFGLPRTAHVVLKIYNVIGEEIRTLADNYVEAGFHSISWDGKDETGRDLPSGIYVYRLYVGPGKAFVEVKKLTLLR